MSITLENPVFLGFCYTDDMVKLIDKSIYRGGEKIGWIENDHIFNHSGEKLGYFEGHSIYDHSGHKIAYIENDFLVPQGGSSTSKVRLEDVAGDVTGGVIPEIARAAIYILLGS